MRKKSGLLLALWGLAVLLFAGLLSGCAASTQNDRRTPSAAVSETEEITGTDAGKTDETVKPSVGETTDEIPQAAKSDESGRDLESAESAGDAVLPEEEVLPENGSYTSKEEVALYLYTYGHLPDNFIRKNDAKKLGWDNSKGNLAKVAPGKSIGGDRFGNYEGLLPDEEGRKWTECDIGYEEGYRNGERIVFSNDGLIYYTGDHYKSFERLYEGDL